jgi:acetyl-CoA acetyltransferase
VAVPRPVEGVRRLLDRIELPIETFDLVEINEAVAAQTLADGRELGFEWDRVDGIRETLENQRVSLAMPS